MNAAAVAIAAVLGLGTACGGGATATPPPPPSSTARTQVAPTDTPADDRTGIPRVDGNDVAPPGVTTRTTVIENRPAVVVTLADAVLFAFGSAELRPGATPALQTVLDLLRQHPAAQAEVAGHTDAVGTPEYNRMLSQQRAAAVVDWLVDHGIARTRLHAVGYGATHPVAPDDTDENRQRNRRVELTVRDA
jgi:outer membrane protein OmpA-like peptidoglycan-associated protein